MVTVKLKYLDTLKMCNIDVIKTLKGIEEHK